jgi:voltage-gated potassium channel
MSELEGPQLRAAPSGSDQHGRVPLTTRLLLKDSLTARRAAGVIAGVTVLVTVAGGMLERLLDHQEFPTIGKGLWFSLETVTTVGYGDATPERASGRIIAAVVMLTAIAFVAVVTASATAALVESGRRRFAASSELDVEKQLDEVNARLARIEAALGQGP